MYVIQVWREGREDSVSHSTAERCGGVRNDDARTRTNKLWGDTDNKRTGRTDKTLSLVSVVWFCWLIWKQFRSTT